MINAQNETGPTGDVTIKPMGQEVKYCLGPTSYFPTKEQPAASDITLRLSLKLLYKNNRSGPIILPLRFRSLVRMIVVGGQEALTVLSRDDPFDPNAIASLTRPEPPYFIVVPGARSEFRYFGELVDMRVRSSDKQLLGKRVQFFITRDHGLLPIDKLETKWKSYGTLWNGVQESEPVIVSIPESPETVDCRKDDKF